MKEKITPFMLGVKAYQSGKFCIPAQDEQLLEIVEAQSLDICSGVGMTPFGEWIAGWDSESEKSQYNNQTTLNDY